MLVSYLSNRQAILFFSMTFLSLQRLYEFISHVDVMPCPSSLRARIGLSLLGNGSLAKIEGGI
jgi:hypothetical protein